jgi:hypothetical protein
MATKRSSSTANPFTPAPGPTQKLGDFLRAPGPAAKPPSTAGKSTGRVPTNQRPGGGKR